MTDTAKYERVQVYHVITRAMFKNQERWPNESRQYISRRFYSMEEAKKRMERMLPFVKKSPRFVEMYVQPSLGIRRIDF